MTIAICIVCVFICIWLDGNKKEKKEQRKIRPNNEPDA